MNIQFYWDGNSGAIEYETRKQLYTEKPVVPTVSYDAIVYSEDDHVATKILSNVTHELTPEEIVAIKQFCNANAVEQPYVPSEQVDLHNRDPQSHADIRAKLAEVGKGCFYSIYSFEEELKGDTTLNFKYAIADALGCADTDPTKWICPADGSYDVTLRIGFEAVQAPATATIQILKGSAVLKQGTLSFTETEASRNPVAQLQIKATALTKGESLSIKIKGLTTGITVLSRSYLLVTPKGQVTGERVANYYFHTLGNILFVDGYQAMIGKDSNNKPAIMVGTHTEEITLM